MAVKDKPSLSAFTITNFPLLTDGFTFRIQIKVFTTQRESLSEVAFITKASVPDQPSDVPVQDPTGTSDTQIKVIIASPAPGNGGSVIISYEIQMDDGLSGDYVSIIGFDTNSLLTTYTITSGIIKGREHRFRYRARNAIGWGPFSSESSILAATVPTPPPSPTFSSFSASTLYINVLPSSDNGGTDIIDYELWVDAGDDFSSAFTKLTNYNGASLIYGANNANDGIVIGKTYRFKTRSHNLIGFSEFSEDGYIAFGDVPSTPAAPTRVSST